MCGPVGRGEGDSLTQALVDRERLPNFCADEIKTLAGKYGGDAFLFGTICPASCMGFAAVVAVYLLGLCGPRSRVVKLASNEPNPFLEHKRGPATR